jgi:peptidoglycan hydrolase CwlO-like protein
MSNERPDIHQRFKELAALAQSKTLSPSERLELEQHLERCHSCREIHEEYSLISSEGLNFLAAAHGASEFSGVWGERRTRNKLFARIRKADQPQPGGLFTRFFSTTGLPPRAVRNLPAAVVACLLIVVAAGAYRLGSHTSTAGVQPIFVSPVDPQALVVAKQASDDLVAVQQTQLTRLEMQLSSSKQEITRLRGELQSAEARSTTLQAMSTAEDEQLHKVSEERDKFANQLREAEQSYQLVQAELTNLRAEHEQVLLRITSLQSKIDELSAEAHDQEHKLRDDEQYLAADRDIRDLMGARRLYIADVFDVDSGSRTRKPFGRVFYTESKSLIFYAFDLDRQPGVKNASAYQVWGKRDAESGEKNRAMNLGILYMDSESNRRWVLRLDDPKQLSEIDAVFVTVEPPGGSQRPTGKPFLYALLRREANHP